MDHISVNNTPVLYPYLRTTLFLLLFLLTALPALLLTAPFVEDSLGTMATAAYLTGHDWSAFLAEDGYFYKYGASLWYLLPFALTEDPVLRYRLMLLVNSALHVLSVWLCYRLLLRLGQREEEALPISLLTGLLPSALLYGKLTWAEPVLFLLPWVTAHLQLSLSEKGLPPGRRRLYSALLAWCAAYAYMTHLRGIVLVLSVTLTALAVRCKNKGTGVQLPWYLGSLAAALLADRFLTRWEKLAVYGGAELQHNTLSQFLHSGIWQLLTPSGLAALLKTAVGWLFHTGAAGLGLTLAGLLAMLCASLGALRKKELSGWEIVSIQGILSYFGAFALGLLFFFQYYYAYWTGSAVERCDRLVFGRYLESSLPLLMAAGLSELELVKRHQGTRLRLLAAGAILAACTLFTGAVIAPAMAGADCYVHSLMALNLFMDSSCVSLAQDFIPNLGQAVTAFGAAAIAAYAAVCCLYRKHKTSSRAILAALFAAVYFRSFFLILLRVDSAALTKFARFYLTQ